MGDRSSLNVDDAISWAGVQTKYNGQSELSTSPRLSLLPDCGCHVTSHSFSSIYAFPGMVDSALNL